jgi:hypothetical protein
MFGIQHAYKIGLIGMGTLGWKLGSNLRRTMPRAASPEERCSGTPANPALRHDQQCRMARWESMGGWAGGHKRERDVVETVATTQTLSLTTSVRFGISSISASPSTTLGQPTRNSRTKHTTHTHYPLPSAPSHQTWLQPPSAQ